MQRVYNLVYKSYNISGDEDERAFTIPVNCNDECNTDGCYTFHYLYFVVTTMTRK